MNETIVNLVLVLGFSWWAFTLTALIAAFVVAEKLTNPERAIYKSPSLAVPYERHTEINSSSDIYRAISGML